MTYEVYRYIFYGGMILAMIFLVVSVILFFVLKIPVVIGDLTGVTARRAIEDIRNRNEETGEKVYKSSVVNKQRGRLTDKISESGRIISKKNHDYGGAMATEKIATQGLGNNETTVLDTSNETTVLNASNETTVLSSGQTMNETTVLSQNMNNVDAAEIGNTAKLQLDSQIAASMFVIEHEITFIHTNEVIV